MSVTFWCPDAPTTRSVPYPDQDPSFTWEESALPTIELSNVNARAAIEMVGLSADGKLSGRLSPSEFGPCMERLRVIMEEPVHRAPFIEPDSVNDRVVTQTNASKAPGPKKSLEEMLAPAEAVSYAQLEYPRLAGVVKLLVPQNQSLSALRQDRTCGPAVISLGRSDHYLRNQAERFLDLFSQAKANNFDVFWG